MVLACLDDGGNSASHVAYCYLGGGILNQPPNTYGLVFKGLPMCLLTRLLAMTCWLGWLNADDVLLIRRQNGKKSDWISQGEKEAACLCRRDEVRSLHTSLLDRSDEVLAALEAVRSAPVVPLTSAKGGASPQPPSEVIGTLQQDQGLLNTPHDEDAVHWGGSTRSDDESQIDVDVDSHDRDED